VNKITKEIKLVVWDLDETFWHGTLSEEGVEYLDYNHNLIIKLTSRGIINSICSKNNYKDVERYLRKKEIFDYFVFSVIEWQPKGLSVQKIIKRMRLRPENVLFIDDNPSNLHEVISLNEGINVCHPKFISKLLQSQYMQGKNDEKHTRLLQYKNLEKKVKKIESSIGSNLDFLRDSRITVQVHYDCLNEIDRIHELITRTNQLNFTKNRASREDIKRQFLDKKVKSGYISVKDRYGDYGITGFYMIINKKLEHFLFSCRAMNMYIEKWLYNKIGNPELDVMGEVTSSLYENIDTKFITELCINDKRILDENTLESKKILLMGGCDLDQVVYYLNTPLIETEFNYVNNYNLNVHKDNTELLRQFKEYKSEYDNVIKKIPVLNMDDIKLKINNVEWEILVFSVLNDYSRGLYKHRKTGFILPFDSFNIDWTKKNNWKNLPKHLLSIPKDFLIFLNREFEFIGAISPNRFKDNLKWLVGQYPNKKFIFLNGSEQEVVTDTYWERDMHLRHVSMNKVLVELKDLSNVTVVDVNSFIQTRGQHTDNVRHYHKVVYKKIADKIVSLIAIDSHYSITTNPNYLVIVKQLKNRVYKTLRTKIKKYFF
jgi:FkbH-like protein